MIKKIETVQKTLQKLGDTIEAAAQSQQLSSNDLAALKRDREFIETAMHALASYNPDEINALWINIQNLSRFFGGDYLQYSKPKELEELSNSLFDAMLDLIAEIRKG
jgi:hypothetical protein